MKKWICKECGYAHYGDVAPERCPQCGAPRPMFFQEGKTSGCLFSFIATIIMMTVSIFSFFLMLLYPYS